MPDPADYPYEYGIYDYEWDDEDDETVWDAASACLGMIGVYMLVSCLIVLICILTLQLV